MHSAAIQEGARVLYDRPPPPFSDQLTTAFLPLNDHLRPHHFQRAHKHSYAHAHACAHTTATPVGCPGADGTACLRCAQCSATPQPAAARRTPHAAAGSAAPTAMQGARGLQEMIWAGTDT